ncbi:chromate transporter [Paenibacillus cymbidii]|uniref:chromate transporter n=1 Tax=Paenibacillus cymbidii TaxID=1639034 RepID=UPI001F45826C|nr:chromate transporter [Paenibacillus cymbidii]
MNGSMVAVADNRWKKLWLLFLSFAAISPITFGGGYAMIPAIEREVVARRKWIAEKEMAEVLSIAGSAPGGIGVNAAAFIGFRLGGLAGAIVAVIGMTLPTFLIVIGLSFLYAFTRDNAKVEAAFIGLRSGIIALILYAGYKMARSSIIDRATLCAAVATVALLLALPVHPLLLIVAGALYGVSVVWLKQKLGMSVKLGSEGDESLHIDDSGYYIVPDYFVADGI